MRLKRVTRLFRALIVPIVGGLGLCLASPAAAIGCAKAGNGVEKRICASKELKAADASLNSAYTALLRAAPDTEIRTMIVKSQRRWIEARDTGLASDFEGQPLPIGVLRDAIDGRTAELSDRSNSGLIAQALEQRRYFSQFPKGQFSGFASDCEFYPTDRNQESYVYSCMGTVGVQNGDRLCAMDQYWATYSVYTHYGVSRITGGTASPAAYCNPQSGTECDIGESGWQSVNGKKPENFPELGERADKLDAENTLLLDEKAWFTSCLTKTGFPLVAE